MSRRASRGTPVWAALAALAAAGCRCDGGRESGGSVVADAATSGASPGGAPAARWPAWPSDVDALATLVDRHTTRRPTADDAAAEDVGPEPTADRLLALLRGRFRDGVVVAGWPGVTAAIDRRLEGARRAGRPAFLLWGVYHDSAAQLAALRRLVGPLGLSGPLGVVAEPFDADGRWMGLDPNAQRGDDGALGRYLDDGSAAALRQLQAAQQRGNYTAWKFDYLDELLDLVVAARAAAHPVVGCDLPSGLQRLARPKLGTHTERLREVHCALALRDALAASPTPPTVAMLWGQAHLGVHGFERFLPAEAELVSVRLFGARPEAQDVARALGRRLALGAPVLVPTDALGHRLVLLLPGPELAASVDRVLAAEGCPLPADQRHRLRLSSVAAGLLHVERHRVELDDEPRSVVLPPGDHAFLFESEPAILAGVVHMPPGGQAALDLDPAERTLLVTLHGCEGEPARTDE